MRSKRAASPSIPGPLRWGFRQYLVSERPTPTGRRFEVRSPQDDTVLFCRVKRSDPGLVFFADDEDATELFRLEPRHVRPFQRSYEAVDSTTGMSFGQIRKRVYEPQKKTEWFLFNPDGEQIGLVTETAADPTLLRRLLPVDRLHSKAWALHWGQSIGGKIQPRPGFMGERCDVDLSLDTKDEIDRRLVLGATIALRADPHHAEPDGA